MKWFFGAVLAAMFVLGLGGRAGAADDKEVNAILDKAIKALGGEEKLSKIKAATWKTKGTINLGGTDNEFTGTTKVQGLDHFRSSFEGEFGGNKVMGLTVLAKDKGWRKFNDDKRTIDGDALANEKRNVYLQVVPMMLLPLKGDRFKVQTAGEKKVGDKPALGLKVTGPEGKDFTLFFDKDSGLPVQMEAKVIGFMGEEHDQETVFADYKDFAGIKKATKVSSKRGGEKFIVVHITEFKVLDTVDPKTFAEPQ